MGGGGGGSRGCMQWYKETKKQIAGGMPKPGYSPGDKGPSSNKDPNALCDWFVSLVGEPTYSPSADELGKPGKPSADGNPDCNGEIKGCTCSASNCKTITKTGDKSDWSDDGEEEINITITYNVEESYTLTNSSGGSACPTAGSLSTKTTKVVEHAKVKVQKQSRRWFQYTWTECACTRL